MHRTIRAHVDPTAISRVSRFFDASTTQIIHEMLQNARRAGATSVLVDVDATRVTITDNGRGIADPAILLAFGTSGWDEAATRNEDPAGMGFFSLARRDAVIDSAPAPDGEPWRIELQPEHFLGRLDAEVRPGGQPPTPHGTRVSFSHNGDSEGIKDAVRNAARYGPLDVSFDNQPVERADFLAENQVVHTETHGGVRIGVRHGPTTAWDRPRLNFHGLQIDCEHLPTVMPVDEYGGRTADPWWVMVDVIEAPELELVLPARKQVVRNAFLQRLAHNCRATIFRAIRNQGKETRLTRADALEAKEHGITLPVPLPELHTWKPRTANDWDWDPSLHRRTLPVRPANGCVPLLMNARLDAPTQQVITRTLEGNGMLEHVFHPKPGFEGYPWYDAIERITRIEVTAEADGRITSVTNTTAMSDSSRRFDRITVELHVENTRCEARTIRLDTDAALLSNEPETPDEIEVLLTRNATIDTDALTRLMTNSFFTASEDSESDSEWTQRTAFERDCRLIAASMIESRDEARTAHLEGLARDHLANALESGETLTIGRDRDGSLQIEVLHD